MSTQADVAVSYDVDNDFFRLWLDPAMNYTCAVFDDTDDLAEAQRAKLEVLAEFAGVDRESRVLDIGCGWGANLEHLVRVRQVRAAHGITLSPAQHEEIIRRRLPRVTADCVDYRDFRPAERFDAVMSICMIEHVVTPEEARAGRQVQHYRDYFRRAWEWTEPGARFALQTILRDRVPRDRADAVDVGWVTRTIFPGAITPRLEDVVRAVSPYWEILEIRTRREDYRRTCEHWLSRLRSHEEEIRARWGDEVFDDYERYLATCVRAFERHYQSLAQLALRRIDS
jgi:cyclopropane-fatty-acyl-phospholipid synthase